MGFLPSNITALRKQEQLLSSAYTYIYGVAIDVADADAGFVLPMRSVPLSLEWSF